MAVCRGCGAQPREGARFCDSCGAALESCDSRAEYKQVTVLFTDVVRSMDIAAALDPERLREVMGEVFDLCARVVKRFGGTVDKFTGDGIMALFGAPAALEDHAYRACLAALDIQRDIERLAANVDSRNGVALQLRIGINSGAVIVGEISTGAAGYTAVGEHVGLAQRMESIAPPGGVMLGESTAKLVVGRVVMAEPELVQIKGLQTSIRARQLLPATLPAGDRPRDEPKLVGRTWELSALVAMIDQAVSGTGGLVGVVGPPGIGKSRLTREATTHATNQQIAVYTAYCESHTGDIAFRAASGLLRSVFGIEGLDDSATRAALRRRLSTADDTDITLLEDLLGIREHVARTLEVAPDARRRRVTGLLNTAALSRDAPAVVVVEDAHWIDPASEAMLADFASVLSQTWILMVVTYRPEYRGPLAQAVSGQRISLTPLRDAQTADLLDTIVGTDTSTIKLKAHIAVRADGNPFFAQEMVRDLSERGVLDGLPGRYVCQQDTTDIGIPATLQSTIAARIDRLDRRGKRTLNAAAVLGGRFGGNVLKRLLGEVDVAAAVNADLLEQVAYTPDPEYAFRHPLIRAVAYESQLRSDRCELHRQVAAAIASDETGTDRNAAMIAEHHEAAGDFADAFAWHMRAGDWFASRDVPAARSSWRRARDIADLLPIDIPGRTTMQIAARLPLTGSAWRVGAPVADTGYEELRLLAIESNDHNALAVAMIGQCAMLGLHDDLDTACALTAELVALVGSLDDADVVLAALTVSMYAIYQSGRMHALLDQSQRVIDMADGDKDKGTRFSTSPLATATVLRAIARIALGIPGWREDFADATALGRICDPTTLAIVLTYKYVFAIPAGVLVADDVALSETAELARAAERFGDDFTLSGTHLTRGITLACHDSTRNEAFEMLASATEAAAKDRFLTAAIPTADVQYARHLLRSGDTDSAIRLARRTAEDMFGSGNAIIAPQVTTVLVEALLHRSGGGDIDEASSAIARFAATSGGYTFQELPLLYQRALLEKARENATGYRDLRDDYRKIAHALRFEGHMASADAMD
ncbi:MAG: AAA family ATPase [Mycobacterium sp.]|nr:AAA family ATPase [Mycobacterium sp.]